MMRSLWSGVSGLGAHQIAMDVEGNNIANVNTVGFKYARANFDSMLYQTHRISTAPQGEMGGVNGMQVGLGTQVESTTQIFKQGSVQTTEKKTDLAIQGDGFFIVSPNGGYSYNYTRNGDFLRDKNGNFVNNAGYIVQGWMRDEDTGEIDNTTPIKNIVIKPGLTTPAKKTENVTLKGVLNSGNNIGEKKIQIYELDEYHNWKEKDGNGIKTSEEVHSENDISDNEFKTTKNKDYRLTDRGVDMGVLFNSKGEAYNLRDGQGIWVSYSDAKTKAITIPTVASRTLDITINGTQITGTIENINNIAALINQFTQKTGVSANIVNSNQLVLINKNNIGSESNTKNIKLNINKSNTVNELQNLVDGYNPAATPPKTSVSVITAYQYTYTSREASSAHKYDDGTQRTFKTTEDLRHAMQTDARLWVNYSGDGDLTNIELTGVNKDKNLDLNDGVTVTVNSQGQFEIKNPKGDAFNYDDGDSVDIITKRAGEIIIGGTALRGGQTIGANELINYDEDKEVKVTIYDKNGTVVGDETIAKATPIQPGKYGAEIVLAAGESFVATGDIRDTATGNIIKAGQVVTGPRTFALNTLENYDTARGVTITFTPGTLASGLAGPVTINAATPGAPAKNAGVIAIPPDGYAVISGSLQINQDGVELISRNNNIHENDRGVFLTVSELTDSKNGIGQNIKFTSAMNTLQGPLNSGQNMRTTQAHYLSAHSTSTQIIDSLGATHDLKFDFTKTGYTDEGGTEWGMVIQVPEPGQINFSGDGSPINVITGTLRFNPNGSIAAYSPSSITFTANNGSEGFQNVNIDFGTVNDFEGLTSYDKKSETGYISQDGYKGGELDDIRIDQTGTIIGIFTNGKSFGLAQVAMAKFINNEGLMSEGGNLFSSSPNSGDAIIGAPGTSGHGMVKASALEMSNVDLSRSLTQLIVVQRGFQANSKTITTSDQMLNTLLQLKQ